MEPDKRNDFNGQIKAIFRGGKIHPIKWGAEDEKGWATWDSGEKLEYAMELASAMNQAADVMQQERNKLLDEQTVLKRLRKNADDALQAQKRINILTITEANMRQQEMAQQIQKLESDLKAAQKQLAEQE